jgi:High-affinity nickel-transport protein
VRNDGRGTLLAHAPDAIRGDGSATAVLMREGYGWALQNPVRRIFYHIAVTTLSVALAMILGSVLLLQMAARALGVGNGFWDRCNPSTSAISVTARSPCQSSSGKARNCLEEAHPIKGENMSVEEILGTHRRPLIADVATLAACIDECAACAATCTICADACLAEPDIEALARCIRLCLDCADACVDAGRILSRQTDPDADTQLTALEACLSACRACAAECERHAHHHEHCRLSAEECRRCERACDDLRAALGGA